MVLSISKRIHNLHMEKASGRVANNIVEQAIAWYLQVNAAQHDADVKAKFDSWIKQDTSHAKAYEQINRIFKPLEGIDVKAAKESIVSVLHTERKLKRRRNASGIAFAITMFTAIYFGSQSTDVKVMLADNKTAIGESKTLVLPDQSSIIMNTNTALDVKFDQHQRIIKLYKGEVYVEVSKDASRPFLVETEHGDIRALGTKFNVNRTSESTHVAMIESKVKACNQPSVFSNIIANSAQRVCVVLHTGQAVTIRNQSLDKVQEIDVDAISSWTKGTVAFDAQPLPKVLSDLQRYSPKKITFSASELNAIKVSGVLPINDLPYAFNILADQFHLQIQQVDSDTIKVDSQK
jgi:transmembrane sensor